MKNRNLGTWLLGATAAALILAVAPLAAVACENCGKHGGKSGKKEARGHHDHGEAHAAMGCPVHVEGAEVKVTNTEKGVTIEITAKDAEVVKKVQAAAAHMAHGVSGCPHCAKKGKAAQEAKQEAEPELYACPMGDYKGPATKDGRCPKCGMNLEKVKGGGK